MSLPTFEIINESSGRLRPTSMQGRIVRACLDLARTHGPEAVTIRRLASALDISATELYRFVSSKGQLFASIQSHGIEELDRWLSDGERAKTAGVLELRCKRYVQFARARPWLYTITFGFSDLELRSHAIGIFTGRVVPILQLCGGVAPDPEQSAQQLWVALHGLAWTIAESSRIEDPGGFPLDGAFVEDYITMLVRGLLAPPPLVAL